MAPHDAMYKIDPLSRLVIQTAFQSVGWTWGERRVLAVNKAIPVLREVQVLLRKDGEAGRIVSEVIDDRIAEWETSHLVRELMGFPA